MNWSILAVAQMNGKKKITRSSFRIKIFATTILTKAPRLGSLYKSDTYNSNRNVIHWKQKFIIETKN